MYYCHQLGRLPYESKIAIFESLPLFDPCHAMSCKHLDVFYVLFYNLVCLFLVIGGILFSLYHYWVTSKLRSNHQAAGRKVSQSLIGWLFVPRKLAHGPTAVERADEVVPAGAGFAVSLKEVQARDSDRSHWTQQRDN